MTYKAFLQTKTGEVEGVVQIKTIKVSSDVILHWCDFTSPLADIETDADFTTEAAALAHFKKHFGRIEREGK